ncbi:MAG TPA: NADH-quinone oxidoreductase subunit NuoB [Phycisphaerae bacterium]|nr:NADH-quinone oxidoreductase subunit NuoB [Phycisphaerae bacterium]
MALKNWALRKSLWVYHVNAGACNNCDIEVLELLTPRYDIERFGMILVGSPRHADVLAVTGVCTRQAQPRLQEVYMQTAKPCVVMAVGSCAGAQGIFTEAYHMGNTVDEAIRAVDPGAIIMYVPGCPPKPEAMISAAVKAIGYLKELASPAASSGEVGGGVRG